MRRYVTATRTGQPPYSEIPWLAVRDSDDLRDLTPRLRSSTRPQIATSRCAPSLSCRATRGQETKPTTPFTVSMRRPSSVSPSMQPISAPHRRTVLRGLPSAQPLMRGHRSNSASVACRMFALASVERKCQIPLLHPTWHAGTSEWPVLALRAGFCTLPTMRTWLCDYP